MPTPAPRGLHASHGAGVSARAPGRDALLVCSIAVAILAFKAPDALTHPQFWAEDGRFLFRQQYGSWVPQLHATIAGYLVVTQRLVAWLAATLSNAYAPLICNACAVLIGAASLTSLRRLPIERSVLWTALAAVALTPTNGEIFGTLTNVQWFTQLYLLVPVARFLGSESPPRPLLAYAAILIVGLSGPFAAFALAAAAGGFLALWLEPRLTTSPMRLPRPTLEIALLIACAILQSYLIARNKPTPLVPSVDALLQICVALQVHTLGERWLPTAAFCLLTMATALTTIWSAESAKARAVVVAVAAFIAAQLWSVACRQSIQPDPAILAWADRYYFVFKIAFWVCLGQTLRVVLRRHTQAALPLTLVAMTGVAIANFPHLIRHRFVDLDWSRYAAQMDRGEAVTVPINPPPWNFSVPERLP